MEALAKYEKAKAFFQTLNKANVYAIVYRLQTARRPETRARRMKMILTMVWLFVGSGAFCLPGGELSGPGDRPCPERQECLDREVRFR